MNSRFIYESYYTKENVRYYYYNLKNKLYNVISYMEKSINSLDNINSNLSNNFKIDSDKLDILDVESIRRELTDRVRFIRNSVIPSINSAINRINQELAEEQ